MTRQHEREILAFGNLNPYIIFCTPLIVCVLILCISGGTYSLKSSPNDRFFWETFLFTFRAFARNLLKGNRRRNNFRILLWCLGWVSKPVFSSNKPTHYLLDHGDFLETIKAAILIWNLKNICLNTNKYWNSFSLTFSLTKKKKINLGTNFFVHSPYMKHNLWLACDLLARGEANIFFLFFLKM